MGILYLAHLHARWMHTHATMVGGYRRHIVVRCRLQAWQFTLLNSPAKDDTDTFRERDKITLISRNLHQGTTQSLNPHSTFCPRNPIFFQEYPYP